MRAPVLKDAFTAAKIVKKLGAQNILTLKSEIDEKVKAEKEKQEKNPAAAAKSEQEIYGEMILPFVLDYLPHCETEIYELLASITEKKPKDVENMAITEMGQVFKEMAQLEGMENFIKQVKGLI